MSVPEALSDLLPALREARLLIIGDAMLDLYTDGPSTRQSPEAPVPVIAAGETKAMPGGAANLAVNAAALAGGVDFICLTGTDSAQRVLAGALARAGVETGGMIGDPTRPTTTKHRYLANGAHVVRIDHEKTHEPGADAAQALLETIHEKMKQAQAVILSDYCKGVLSDHIVRQTMEDAAQAGLPVLVDSKRRDFRIFSGAALVKPNLVELKALTGMPVENDGQVEDAARHLIAQSGIKAVAVSRSENGASLITPDTVRHYPSRARHVQEVSGAGDTMLAALALALAAGAPLAASVELGVIAAGLAVEKSGTSTITHEELRNFLLSSKVVRQSA